MYHAWSRTIGPLSKHLSRVLIIATVVSFKIAYCSYGLFLSMLVLQIDMITLPIFILSVIL